MAADRLLSMRKICKLSSMELYILHRHDMIWKHLGLNSMGSNSVLNKYSMNV